MGLLGLVREPSLPGGARRELSTTARLRNGHDEYVRSLSAAAMAPVRQRGRSEAQSPHHGTDGDKDDSLSQPNPFPRRGRIPASATYQFRDARIVSHRTPRRTRARASPSMVLRSFACSRWSGWTLGRRFGAQSSSKRASPRHRAAASHRRATATAKPILGRFALAGAWGGSRVGAAFALAVGLRRRCDGNDGGVATPRGSGVGLWGH